jgi:NAD(P)-dependent dehydrogenase (short-subunit alcohol dehydrogenase family)
MNQFEGRTAVITGAASGFGEAFAREAAALGMRLMLADVQIEPLERLAQSLRAQGTQVHTCRTDVSRLEDVQALAAATVAHFGTPHLVFNNAGVATGGLVWESSPADWQWVLGVNLMGVLHGVQSFVPLMLAAERADPHYEGYVVNTASMAGLVSVPLNGTYTVSKHAIVALSETLYQDLALVSERIHTSLVCAFSIPTGIAASDKVRPDEARSPQTPTTSQQLAQAMMNKAVSSGKLTAADMSAATFNAIRAQRFYVYSHPHALASVRQRMDDVLQGANPSDPYAERPDLGRQLREQLKPPVARP